MTIEEIKKNAPLGAKSYSDEDGDIVYFDGDGNYYNDDCHHWHEIYFMLPELKQLY